MFDTRILNWKMSYSRKLRISNWKTSEIARIAKLKKIEYFNFQMSRFNDCGRLLWNLVSDCDVRIKTPFVSFLIEN